MAQEAFMPNAIGGPSQVPSAHRVDESAKESGDFGRALEAAQSERSSSMTFSAHAQARMAQRQISLSGDDLARIEKAAEAAADKGCSESLFLLDKLGLIVNVKNRTVLTAVDPQRLREGIVTNIDSTVLISGSDE